MIIIFCEFSDFVTNLLLNELIRSDMISCFHLFWEYI